MGDLDRAVAETIKVLGQVVKKPPLTAKLLNRPRLRFLHDLLMEVIKTTGFLDGLYSGDERKWDKIADKAAKMAFLQKAIDATALATGDTVRARPSKIVAGLDVVETNQWLQSIGRAAAAGVDSSAAVAEVLAGGGPKKKKKKPPSSSKDKDAGVGASKDADKGERAKGRSSSSSRDKGKSTDKERSRDRREREAGSARSRKPARPDEPTASPTSAPSVETDPAGETRAERPTTARGSGRKRQSPLPGDEQAPGAAAEHEAPPPAQPERQEEPARQPEAQPTRQHASRPEPEAEMAQAAHAAAQQAPAATEARKEEEEDAPLPGNVHKNVRRRERPGSARPAPPRERKSNVPMDSTTDSASRAGSAKPEVTIIRASEDQPEEDDTFIVVDSGATDAATADAEAALSAEAAQADDGEQGALMRKIMEKKAREGSQADVGTVNDAQRRKDREHAEKEVR